MMFKIVRIELVVVMLIWVGIDFVYFGIVRLKIKIKYILVKSNNCLSEICGWVKNDFRWWGSRIYSKYGLVIKNLNV